MTIPVWPTDLPQRFLQDGFTQALGEGRLKTQMESGPPKTRRRFSLAPAPIQGVLLGTEDDWQRVRRFWEEETVGGSLPFLMPDQTLDSINLDDGQGNVVTSDLGCVLLIPSWWTCLFGDNPPSRTPAGGLLYRITIPLTVMP